jgi:hypothetical protein
VSRFQDSDAGWSLELLAAMRLVTAWELGLVRGVIAEAALAECVERAETIHLHVKVADTGRLARAGFEAGGGALDYAREGFVKYRLPGGINAIFSHIPVSADDLRESAAGRPARAFLDHIGIDLREVDAQSRAAFDALPRIASLRGWAHVAQGAAGRAVRCCHVEVAEKHWMYPSGDGARPIEIAFGPLRRSEGASGCDLRPADPRLAVGAPARCCAA